MEKFIRIDVKGHWKGTEHCSTLAMDPDFFGDETRWEEGISCYTFEFGKADALENLRKYWVGIVGDDEASLYKDKQITIFKGEDLGIEGADYENMATCTNTLKELEAVHIMQQVIEAWERWEIDQEIDEDEYMDILNNIEL